MALVKPKLIFAWLAAAVLLPSCASVLDEDGALAITSYDIQENGRIVVDVRVNGEGPFAFALDTGATISVVFDELRKELALELVPGKALKIHGLVASGTFPFVSISRLEVGRETWADPRIASLPGDTAAGTSIDGILGVDFLRRYAVGLSVRDRLIRLYPPELVAGRAYRGWASIPLEPAFIGESGAALYLFEIEIGAHRLPAIFDLGAGLNLLNHAAAELIGLDAVASRDRDVLSGAIESAPLMARFRIDEVKTGHVHWRYEEFRVAELELFTTLMRSDTPYALLGAGLFMQRDFIIDFTRNRLLVKVAMDEVGAGDNEVGEPNARNRQEEPD